MSATPSFDFNSDDAVGLKICWKGPKGNKTCITISKGLIEYQDGEDLLVNLNKAMDGFILLSGFPKGAEGETFLIERPQEIGNGKVVSPGKYTVRNGMCSLKIEGIPGERTRR